MKNKSTHVQSTTCHQVLANRW